ncbi:hypothetical protein BpHYR1_011447 [Brachionus plicatilis]|uniref:Uncharacterized protein n=1 Tax=Brachionus plicatilis TaxID=10195 RepID=A0A3M7QEB0_BRAPC|nr:hypothetical protein BpHYR1_011447 [Brachionus plicatilis]
MTPYYSTLETPILIYHYSLAAVVLLTRFVFFFCEIFQKFFFELEHYLDNLESYDYLNNFIKITKIKIPLNTFSSKLRSLGLGLSINPAQKYANFIFLIEDQQLKCELKC